jgi:hypothetical protein
MCGAGTVQNGLSTSWPDSMAILISGCRFAVNVNRIGRSYCRHSNISAKEAC